MTTILNASLKGLSGTLAMKGQSGTFSNRSKYCRLAGRSMERLCTPKGYRVNKGRQGATPSYLLLFALLLTGSLSFLDLLRKLPAEFAPDVAQPEASPKSSNESGGSK